MASTIGVDSSLLSSDGRPLLEPGALYVDGSYALRLNAWCSIAGVTLALRSRFLRADGTGLVNSGDQLVLTSNRALNTLDVQLAVGFPLNAMVFALAGAPLVGQCFVQVQIVSGAGPASFPLATVLQGYVTATQALSWPGSPIESAIAGGGYPFRGIVAAPAAGAEFGQVVPVAARWRLNAIIATLTTDATAGNRHPVLAYNDGLNFHAIMPNPGTVGPSTSLQFVWGSGLAYSAILDAAHPAGGLIADYRLLAGHNFESVTAGLGPADQWNLIHFQADEWLDV